MRSDPLNIRAAPPNRLPSITFLTDAFTAGTGGHQAGMRLKAGYGVSIHRDGQRALRIQLREICVFGFEWVWMGSLCFRDKAVDGLAASLV